MGNAAKTKCLLLKKICEGMLELIIWQKGVWNSNTKINSPGEELSAWRLFFTVFYELLIKLAQSHCRIWKYISHSYHKTSIICALILYLYIFISTLSDVICI